MNRERHGSGKAVEAWIHMCEAKSGVVKDDNTENTRFQMMSSCCQSRRAFKQCTVGARSCAHGHIPTAGLYFLYPSYRCFRPTYWQESCTHNWDHLLPEHLTFRLCACSAPSIEPGMCMWEILFPGTHTSKNARRRAAMLEYTMQNKPARTCPKHCKFLYFPPARAAPSNPGPEVDTSLSQRESRFR